MARKSEPRRDAQAKPEPTLLQRANELARVARELGFSCTVELGDKRTPYKPEISVEIWKREDKAA